MNDDTKGAADSNPEEDLPTIASDGSGRQSGKESSTTNRPVSQSQVLLERPGDSIGPYLIVSQLGEGGFGVVYLAEQSVPIKRKVALKVIKPGMDSAEIIGRFEAERQALAVMDHPGVARVYDAGTTEAGRPYFVMELVEGVPVTEYCDSRSLSLRKRLELFQRICAAVQHAHQKGVIHRDLKPSNLLVTEVDGKPAIKVIDFGIAKSLSQSLSEKTLFTVQGQFMGTPQYMSPEQSGIGAVDVDTRSDIYSLGVVLYELLTGRPPFDAGRFRQAALDEVIRIIQEEDPPKPSTRLNELSDEEITAIAKAHGEPGTKLTRQVRGDLDWIVMKALEKDRGRRYETAGNFAEDLDRFLNSEVVTARPPSAGYQLRKFARRHKVILITSGMIMASLIAASVVSLSQASRARKESQRAEVEKVKAETSAEESEAVLGFLQKELLSIAKPKALGGLGQDTTMVEAVKKAEEEISGAFEGQPIVASKIRYTLGLTWYEMGEVNLAIPQLERSLELSRAVHGDDHSDNLAIMKVLRNSYRDAENFKKLFALSEEELAIFRSLEGENNVDYLEKLQESSQRYFDAGDLDRSTEMQSEFLRIVHDHEIENLEAGHLIFLPPTRFRSAEKGAEIERIIEQNKKVLSWGSDFFGPANEVVTQYHSDLSNYYRRLERFDELIEHEKSRFEMVVASGRATTTEIAAAFENYLSTLEGDDARKAHEEFLEEQVVDLKIVNDLDQIEALRTVIKFSLEAGFHDEAIELVKKVLARSDDLENEARGLMDSDPRKGIKSLRNLAGIYDLGGFQTRQISLLNEIVTFSRDLKKSDEIYSLRTLSILSESFRSAGEVAIAVRYSEEVFEAAMSGVVEDKTVFKSLTDSHVRHLDLLPELEAMSRILEWYRNHSGVGDPEFRNSAERLSDLYWLVGRPRKAVEIIEQEITAAEANLGPLDEQTLLLMRKLAGIYEKEHEADQAIGLRIEIVERLVSSIGPNHSDTLSARGKLGEAYFKIGEVAKSLEQYEEVAKRTKESFGESHTKTLEAVFQLASRQALSGRMDEARKISAEYEKQDFKNMPLSAFFFEFVRSMAADQIAKRKFTDAEDGVLAWFKGVESGVIPFGVGIESNTIPVPERKVREWNAGKLAFVPAIVDPFADPFDLPAPVEDPFASKRERNEQAKLFPMTVSKFYREWGKYQEAAKWAAIEDRLLDRKKPMIKRTAALSEISEPDPFGEGDDDNPFGGSGDKIAELIRMEKAGSFQYETRDWVYQYYPEGNEKFYYGGRHEPNSGNPKLRENMAELRAAAHELLCPVENLQVSDLSELPILTDLSNESLVSRNEGLPLAQYFRNDSNEPVSLVWMDFHGLPRFYGSIYPGEIQGVQTRPGAIWMIVGSFPGDLPGYFFINDEDSLAVIPEMSPGAVTQNLEREEWFKMVAAVQKTNRLKNHLGMKFVPVPGTRIQICEHETRVQDYRAFIEENPGRSEGWKEQPFEGQKQTDVHPVVNISWNDASAFCDWLSRKEGRNYRLPTDHEWSLIAGIGHREDPNRSPKEKDEKIKEYPGGGDRITLRLANVPLIEALRYTTALAQMKYRIHDGAVELVPLSVPDEDQQAPEDEAIIRKLKTIIIPAIEFVNTPLRDALLFLEVVSERNDLAPDPNHRGIKFALSGAGAVSVIHADTANLNLAPQGFDEKDSFPYTAPVKSFKADRFGVYDISGNVWEWCSDWYSNEKQLKVLRGSAWDSVKVTDLLLSRRMGKEPDERSNSSGFRCVLELR